MIHIYHPNKAVKGFACSFWRAKDGNLMATIVKQSGWDTEGSKGSFKASFDDPNKHVNIKLSPTEACGILDCIDRNRPFSTFHQSNDSPKSISFTPWMSQPIADDDGHRPDPVQLGFSFAITVKNTEDPASKNSFYIGLTFAEARYVREFLIHSVRQTFQPEIA